MQPSKPRVIKSYEGLEPDIQEQIKLTYPRGFAQHLISYTNAAGEKVSALIFETDTRHYLVKMTQAQARQIIADDVDFGSDGILKDSAREEYEDKYGDLEYMSDALDSDEEDEDVEQQDSDGDDRYDDDY